jgi:hypothetical protein
MRELTYTCEEYRAAHNATSPGMGILWERTLGTAVSTAALPRRVGKSRQILRAEGGLRALPLGSHVGGGKERESTSSCETLHKLWTRLLNNAWGDLVSAHVRRCRIPQVTHKNYSTLKMRSFQTETAETAALTNYESRRNAHDTFLGCCVNGLTQASAFSPAIRTWGCLRDLHSALPQLNVHRHDLTSADPSLMASVPATPG